MDGGNVHVAIKKQRKNEIRLDMRKEKSIRKRMVKGFENIGNIPALQMSGRSSRIYRILRGFQHGSLLYRVGV